MSDNAKFSHYASFAQANKI